MKGFLLTVSLLLLVAVSVVMVIKHIELKQNCTGYLKRAADAKTAKLQLNKAIAYLEQNNLTSGYTSVLWKTPDEDIEFWYKNLKASEGELSKVDSTTSSLERTNILMKLRETLLDNSGESGDSITVPEGLSRYPDNYMYGVLFWITLIFVIVFAAIFVIFEDF
jgi:hypothetical protein